jgi:endonuclease YncB( thermonuclease family)
MLCRNRGERHEIRVYLIDTPCLLGDAEGHRSSASHGTLRQALARDTVVVGI